MGHIQDYAYQIARAVDFSDSRLGFKFSKTRDFPRNDSLNTLLILSSLFGNNDAMTASIFFSEILCDVDPELSFNLDFLALDSFPNITSEDNSAI